MKRLAGYLFITVLVFTSQLSAAPQSVSCTIFFYDKQSDKMVELIWKLEHPGQLNQSATVVEKKTGKSYEGHDYLFSSPYRIKIPNFLLTLKPETLGGISLDAFTAGDQDPIFRGEVALNAVQYISYRYEKGGHEVQLKCQAVN